MFTNSVFSALICKVAVVLTAAVLAVGGMSSAWAKTSKKAPVAAVKKSAHKAAPARTKAGKVALRAHSAHRFQRIVHVEPPRLSQGQMFGLHRTGDPLELKSSVALVLDQDTNEVLFAKNPQAVLPIASITKLMTAIVVDEAKLPMDEVLTIGPEDVDTEKNSRSRLQVGTAASREEMLHLALMSSENRAANSLGRHYPGGLQAFVVAMNRKAKALGMADTRFMEPTGLSSQNQSSASDLALLVKAASQHEVIRRLSTSLEYDLNVGDRQQHFRNTNLLVRNGTWDIGLQKTGYISEAGRCLVMQAQLAGRKLIMVFLDSAGTYSRLGDAERVRRWLADGQQGGGGRVLHTASPQG
jgi:serine-type D-Ala-D-Ala endopeptidase (penicillin-binding protein 7)